MFEKQLLQYVNPKGPLPEIKGQGTLVIVGGAACVWDDLSRYSENGDVLAVNDIANYFPGPIHHIASHHPEKMPFFSYTRPQAQTHAHFPGPCVNHAWPLERDGGTSGIFGVFIGLLMGYGRIILAGIPCDGQHRFFEPASQEHQLFGRDEAFVEWERAYHLFKGRVFSMSGRTRELLGAP